MKKPVKKTASRPSKKSLGKGLGALFEQVEEVRKEEVRDIPIKEIVPNPDQVRRDFDQKAIEELAESIANHGLLEPILLMPKGSSYIIVAGERRYRAMVHLKRDTIPAVVRDFKEEDIKKLSLIENIQRENLNPVEEAISYKELMEEMNLTQAAFAKEIGKSRSHVANSLRLLSLQKDVLQWIREGKISFGHGKILSGLPMDQQKKLAKKILELGLSVRDTEKVSQQKKTMTNPYVNQVENELQDHLMTKVRIRDKKGKGRIEIEYFSPEELERLIELFKSL